MPQIMKENESKMRKNIVSKVLVVGLTLIGLLYAATWITLLNMLK